MTNIFIMTFLVSVTGAQFITTEVQTVDLNGPQNSFKSLPFQASSGNSEVQVIPLQDNSPLGGSPIYANSGVSLPTGQIPLQQQQQQQQQHQPVGNSNSVSDGNITAVPFAGPINFGNRILSPILNNTSQDIDLLIVNNALALTWPSSANGTITISAISKYSIYQIWNYKNRKVMSKDGNWCLSLASNASHVVGVSCNDPSAAEWEANFNQGIFLESKSKRILYADQNPVGLSTRDSGDFPTSGSLPYNAKWITFEVVDKGEAPSLVMIKETPRSTDVLAIQQKGKFLTTQITTSQAQQEMVHVSLALTPNHQETQIRNWVLLDSGRFKNIQMNLCLHATKSSELLFISCDESHTNVSTWEFHWDDGAIVEPTFNQCLTVHGLSIGLKEYAPNHLADSDQWQIYTAANNVLKAEAYPAFSYAHFWFAISMSLISLIASIPAPF